MPPVREFLFEMVQVGSAVKVTAIDPVTGLEASIIGSPSFSPLSLKLNARRKLEALIARRFEEETPPPPKRPGIYA